MAAPNSMKEKMSDSAQIEFIRSVLAIGDGFNDYGDLWESIWWRTDDEYAPVTFFVNCNDLFWWGTADNERITPENLPILLQAVKDVRSAYGVDDSSAREYALAKDGKWDKWYHAGGIGSDLFCARVRKMRPQRPCWKSYDDTILPLFLECGPERDPKEEG